MQDDRGIFRSIPENERQKTWSTEYYESEQDTGLSVPHSVARGTWRKGDHLLGQCIRAQGIICSHF